MGPGQPGGDRNDSGQTQAGVGWCSGKFPDLPLWGGWSGKPASVAWLWPECPSARAARTEGAFSRAPRAMRGPALEPDTSCVSEEHFSLRHGLGPTVQPGGPQQTKWGRRVRPPGCQGAAEKGAGFSLAVVSTGPCTGPLGVPPSLPGPGDAPRQFGVGMITLFLQSCLSDPGRDGQWGPCPISLGLTTRGQAPAAHLGEARWPGAVLRGQRQTRC